MVWLDLDPELARVQPCRGPVGIGDSSTRVDALNIPSGQGKGSLVDDLVAGAQGSDKVGAGRGLGLDVIGQAVEGVAQEAGAAGHGGLGVDRVHHVNAAVVVLVDDGRHVKVGQATPAVEVDLAKHTRRVIRARRDGIVVANPRVGNGDSDVLASGDIGRLNRGEARVGGEVDGAVGVVHGHEGDLVDGACQSGRGEDCESAVLHCDCCRYFYKPKWIVVCILSEVDRNSFQKSCARWDSFRRVPDIRRVIVEIGVKSRPGLEFV